MRAIVVLHFYNFYTHRLAFPHMGTQTKQDQNMETVKKNKNQHNNEHNSINEVLSNQTVMMMKKKKEREWKKYCTLFGDLVQHIKEACTEYTHMLIFKYGI